LVRDDDARFLKTRIILAVPKSTNLTKPPAKVDALIGEAWRAGAGGLATSFVVSPAAVTECAPSTQKDGETFQHVQPRRGPSKGY